MDGSYQTESGGASTADQVKEQARETASQVQERAQQQVQEARGQARQKLREQVDERATQAGERVGSAAGDARSVAEELRRQGKETPARYAEQGAERVERLGSYLRDSDGDAILRDVEDLARSNPWAVAAGGLALGFAAARLLKASSQERYRSSLPEARRHELPAGAETGAAPPIGYRAAEPGLGEPQVPGESARQPATTGGS
jgi:hypothetical protein